MFNAWIDYNEIEPADGEKVLAYTEILNPDNAMFPHMNFKYKGKTLSGPRVRTVEKEFINDGSHNPIAYWQPIENLP